MKKYLISISIVLALFSFKKLLAVPLDINYGGLTSGTTTQVPMVVISSATLPSTSFQWCINHLVVTSPTASTFTMFYSASSTLTPATTSYSVGVSAGLPYVDSWAYKTPFCAPVGNYLGMTESVVGSTFTWEGYSYKGQNP